MTRRVLGALAACAALLCFAAQTAAAQDLVNRQVIRCEYDATWNLRFTTPNVWFADLSYDIVSGTGEGCKRIHAIVFEDGDFQAFQTDHNQSDLITFKVDGVSTTAGGLAGIAQRVDGPASGPLVAANGLLNAEITYLDPAGMQAVNVHRGTGSCGLWCFKTRSVLSVATF